MTPRGATLLRAALGLQATITAAPVVLTASLSPSTLLVLVLAAGAVFAAALEEDLRHAALVYEAVAVALGLVLVVPGALIGVGVLWLLLSRPGRVLLEGAPVVALDVPGAPQPVRPAAPVVPVQVPAPRVVSLDVLPRRR